MEISPQKNIMAYKTFLGGSSPTPAWRLAGAVF
jgi:hypothetical protein